jgi:hypothetical protein
MFTYKIGHSENTVESSTRLEITNTLTGETKVCDDFTYLDDDSQENLEYLFDSDFEAELWDIMLGHLAKIDAQSAQ